MIIPIGFIAKAPHQTQTIDTRVSNCALWLPGSNCSSNGNYDMPNGYPSTWGGVTGLTLDNPGYDFVGGVTASDAGITATNSRNYATASTPILGTVDQTNRNFNNCNCNSGKAAGHYNCYTNCNCNCNCNCDCGK